MYIYLGSYNIEHTYKTESLEDMEAYVKLKAQEYGSGFRGGYATINKIVATKEIEYEYAELNAEDFYKAIEQRKQDYKAIGATVNNDD